MEIYRGDIFYIERPQKNQTQGSEQRADRPAVIVSNNACNTHSEVIEVVFLTTQAKKPLPTHVEVMCHVPSTALCEQVNSVSKERLGGYIRSCTDEEMEAIDEALMVSLGIERKPLPFTENEIKIDELKRQNAQYLRTIEDQDACIDGLRNLVTEQDKTIEDLKQSDKVVILPNDAEPKSETQLVFERNFYKAQYEALFERVI